MSTKSATNPAAFVIARRAYNAAITDLGKACGGLPPLRKACARKHSQDVVTVGLEQWCTYNAEENHADTDGHDDYSEDGPSYLRCSCGRVAAIPTDLDWN